MTNCPIKAFKVIKKMKNQNCSIKTQNKVSPVSPVSPNISPGDFCMSPEYLRIPPGDVRTLFFILISNIMVHQTSPKNKQTSI
jgi:hypothetical protein